MNRFLDKSYGTPYDTVPFDQIKQEDYEPAMMEGMKEELEDVERIANNPEPPTFENTIDTPPVRTLERVTTVFFNLLSAHTNDEMDALAQKMSPILTEHSSKIMLNERLWQRVKHVYHHHRPLTSEEQMLLNKVYDGFVRHGANLCEEDKAKLNALKMELAQLTLQFDQNHLKETNAYELHITSEDDLAGLPASQREAAALAASESGKEGWLFTLHAPSMRPFMMYADNRQLRRQMYMAANSQCTHDNDCNNEDIVRRIVNLRLEMARLLGYDTWADYVLPQRMAQDTQHVYTLLDQLLEAYLPAAKREVEEVREMARRLEGEDFEMMPWDFAYYSHKLKMERYNLDPEMIRPYFELSNVKHGVFGLATRLYGITFEQRSDIPVYHPEVEAWEVKDKDGSFLAILYTDFHPRSSKQSGAWMTSYKEQWTEADGTDSRPHVSMTMNFTKPTPDKPALLTLGEVETFLHEFGHALHGMFSRVRYESLSGTNVYWDFVELPSQFMENYAVEPEFLQTFARHYQTGEALPSTLIERIRESRNFQAAYQCVRQVSLGLLDMAYYTLREPLTTDIASFEREAWSRAQVLPHVDGTCMSVQFGHIMSGGYSAGYYSYKWAEVLDADAFSLFQQNGIFDQATAQRFRDCVLSRGGTALPMDLYVKFRGQEPTIDALLRRNGIMTKQAELDHRYLRMAAIWSENSYCQRRKVGALIVKDKMIISDGYNGTPSGFENVCEDPNNVTIPYVLHAEANAITKIARSGNNSEGSTLYVTDSPCIECAKLIIQAGIKRVIYGRKYRLTEGVDLLKRAGIEVEYVPFA